MKILAVIGTRPEGIKMAPVVKALQAMPGLQTIVCSTGQHRDLLEQALQPFDVSVDVDLAIMRRRQTLNDIVQRVVRGMDTVIGDVVPDRVLVHGDTSTALAAAVTAFNRGVPVAHVEAGLRSFNLARPWPEEMNRRAMDTLSDLLFAPTELARENLLAERAPGRIVVTGNTGVDALRMMFERLQQDPELRAQLDRRLPAIAANRQIVLVTGHRRENLGEGLTAVCRALQRVARRDDVEIVYVTHPNPEATRPVQIWLGGLENVHLLPPQDYLAFVRLLQRADLVLTDSGGVQEEAPALGKKVLVTRTETERPEGVELGAARLVGADPALIEAEIVRLLKAGTSPGRPVIRSPYGDGRASQRIAAVLAGRPYDEFNSTDAPEPSLTVVGRSPEPATARWRSTS